MALGWTGVLERDKNLRDASRYLFGFQCPKENCYLSVACYTVEEATRIKDRHRCPRAGGITHAGWYGGTVTLLEKLWEELDSTVDQIAVLTGPEADLKKQYARGLAFAIAVFMPPHFRSGDEVSAEAGRRRKARVAKDTDYVTPGMQERRYETPPPARVASLEKTERKRHNFTDAEADFIRKARASEMFSLEDLAAMYKVSVVQIQAVLVSPAP